MVACSSGRGGGGDDDDTAGEGEGEPEHRCVDATGQPAADCAVDPAREPCDLTETESCGVLSLEEVWAADGETGPCLHLVAKLDAGDRRAIRGPET